MTTNTLQHIGHVNVSLAFCSPKSPLSRASASGGFRSLRSDSSCGLDKSICWSKAGSSSPWGEEPRKADGVEGCVVRCCCGCCCCCCCGCCGDCCCCCGACCCGLMAPRWLVEEEVPGTEIERKSIWGRPKEEGRYGWEVSIWQVRKLCWCFFLILLPWCTTLQEQLWTTSAQKFFL